MSLSPRTERRRTARLHCDRHPPSAAGGAVGRATATMAFLFAAALGQPAALSRECRTRKETTVSHGLCTSPSANPQAVRPLEVPLRVLAQAVTDLSRTGHHPLTLPQFLTAAAPNSRTWARSWGAG